MRLTSRMYWAGVFAGIVIAFCAAATASKKPKTVDEAVQILKTKG
jgi:hypothetical protein